MTIPNLLTLIGLYLLLAFLAAIVVERSIAGAFKGLRLALKYEFTTDVGRLNFVGMILIVCLMFVFNLHEMFSSALSVEGATRPENRVIAPVALIGFFFVCSLICVMVVERKK